MRKISALTIFFLCITIFCNSQETLLKFTHSYFRSDPYKGTFSSFVNHLLNDPDIKEKETYQRTDTSFFYFLGKYNKFNPFFFKPTRLEVLLTEVPMEFTEGPMPGTDTFFVYQLLAFMDYTKDGINDVKKECEKISRQYKKKFFDANYSEMKKGEEVVGAVNNFFIPNYGIAPVSIAWGKMPNENSAVLNITLRIKSSNNLAVSPRPLYQPQRMGSLYRIRVNDSLFINGVDPDPAR